MKYCFGVDIGGTTVKLGLFTTDGEIVDKWEIKTRTENQGEAVLPDIAEALKEKLEEKKIGRDEVEGIGVGVPAPVNAEGVVQNTANLGWGYKEVKREMEELSGMRARSVMMQCSRTWRNVAGSRQRTQKYRYGNAWNRCRRWNYH